MLPRSPQIVMKICTYRQPRRQTYEKYGQSFVSKLPFILIIRNIDAAQIELFTDDLNFVKHLEIKEALKDLFRLLLS